MTDKSFLAALGLDPEAPVYTTGDLAKALRVTRQHVRTLLESEGVPHLRAGRALRVMRRDAYELLAACLKGGEA